MLSNLQPYFTKSHEYIYTQKIIDKTLCSIVFTIIMETVKIQVPKKERQRYHLKTRKLT